MTLIPVVFKIKLIFFYHKISSFSWLFLFFQSHSSKIFALIFKFIHNLTQVMILIFSFIFPYTSGKTKAYFLLCPSHTAWFSSFTQTFCMSSPTWNTHTHPKIPLTHQNSILFFRACFKYYICQKPFLNFFVFHL